MYNSKIKLTGPTSVYNKITNSRKICWYCGTQNMHTDGKNVSLSSVNLTADNLTLQAALPQVAFKKSKCLDVYVFQYAPHHEDVREAEIYLHAYFTPTHF